MFPTVANSEVPGNLRSTNKEEPDYICFSSSLDSYCFVPNKIRIFEKGSNKRENIKFVVVSV